MKTTNYPRTMLLVLLLSPGLLRATAIANGSLTLTQLQILPSVGTVHFLSPITATAFAEALNSLGEFDQHFTSVDDAVASTSASTTSSAADATASALAFTAAVTGHTGSGPAFSSSTARGGLSGSFEILGATGPVSVQFMATLAYTQFLSTDTHGLSADSEVAFVLNLDTGDQPLFLDNLLQIGSAASDSASFSGAITGNALLDAGAPVSFDLQLDTEHRDRDTPEPASILLIAPALTLRRRARGPQLRC